MGENEEAEEMLDEREKGFGIHVVGGGGGEEKAVNDPAAVPLGEESFSLA